MGFSVVALRHQADARSQADVLLSDLDAAASAQEAALWRALSAPVPRPGIARRRRPRVDDAARRVAEHDRRRADDRASPTRSPPTGRRPAGRGGPRDTGTDAARAAAVETLQSPPLGTCTRSSPTPARRHRDANIHAGLVADVETLFMMVFAAVMAGLLFRRFEAARRSGELGVAAAKAQGEARFQALVHNSSDLITLVDADLAIRLPDARRSPASSATRRTS